MKMLNLCVVAFLALSMGGLVAQANFLVGGRAATVTAPEYHPGLYRHIVTFRFRPEITSSQKREVTRRFLALQQVCVRNGRNYIHSIEAGKANSFEGADQGMQAGFIVTFFSEGDRNFYVGQPLIEKTETQFYDSNHLAFKDFVGPLLTSPGGAFVFDFKVH